VYTFFVAYHPPIPLTCHLYPATGTTPTHTPGRTCSTVIFFNFVEEKKKRKNEKNDTREYPCNISMYMYENPN
jgi:hypothetical protein